MNEWHEVVLRSLALVDESLRAQSDEVTLKTVSAALGYSEYHFSRKFHEVSGMAFRDYLGGRRLALALRDVLDGTDTLLSIAVKWGFSSHEAFTRAFKEAYGITPAEYRKAPRPVALRTVIKPLDCYLTKEGESDMSTQHEVKTYLVTIPAHKFLHIRNYESVGYWDFWEKQSHIPGQDCETICSLLHTIPDKLDDAGGGDIDSGSGQVMAFVNEPSGRLCSWGIPLAECYGVRLPLEYSGPIPEQMQMMDVPEGEYVVFEHGPFSFATENALIEEKMEAAMKAFDYAANGCKLDLTQGRIFYFHHDEKRFWKYIRPIVRV